MDELLNSKKAAALLGISERTLERLRAVGEGPKYVKFGKAGSASVRYNPTDIRCWIEERKRGSTSEDGPDERQGSSRRKPTEPQQTSAL